MNKSFLIIFIWVHSLNASSQIRFIAPNKFNDFVIDPNISWAAETHPSISFYDNSFKKNKSIYDYIITAKKDGTLKSYLRKYNEDFVKSKIKIYTFKLINFTTTKRITKIII